ncbi:MAG: hypothetical protein JEZ00_07680 [Anaerolineaceae bacterium]|nr:hypothetical protein [Anaerolineaceae bacterium]
MKKNYLSQIESSTKIILIMIFVLLLSLLIAPLSIHANEIPVTGFETQVSANQTNAALLPLDSFVEFLINGNEEQIVGIYIDDVFAQKVVQQPESDAAYVSPFNNQITDFGMVSKLTGNIGMLAHNYLSGEHFSDFAPGDIIHVVYGNGDVENFVVDRLESYQALSPHNVYSDFVNLDTNQKYNATQLFETVYGGSYHLTFQTCIRSGDEYSWGRLFVIATPVDLQ